MAGLWQRFMLIFKSKASSALDRAENPTQTLDYSYEQMLTQLQNVKRGVADVVTAKKRLELQTQTIELCLQIFVLLANIAKVDVVLPKITDTAADRSNRLLARNENLNHPRAYQRHGLSGRRVGAANLRVQQDDLRHQQEQQHSHVSVSGEEVFHLNRNYFTVKA